jgi:hypothetical protein
MLSFDRGIWILRAVGVFVVNAQTFCLVKSA